MKSDTSSQRAPKPTPKLDDGGSAPFIDPSLPLFGHLRETGVAALAFFVAVVLVFGDLLFGGGQTVLSIPGGDLANTFVGWSDFCFGEMARGNLPLWNPHLYSGAPCLGGFQEALLYPPNWLHLLLPTPLAFNAGIALHVFLAGFFTYLWMVRRGLEPIAAILAGLVFMFGGAYFLHITPGHLPNLRTMVWAPMIFLAIDDLTVTRSLRGAWLGAAAVAMAILAGHVQYVYYLALVCIPYALLGLWSAVSRPRAAVGLALMGIGGAALAAAQLLTGLQAAQESARSALPYEIARSFPFPPENLLTLIFPDFFGSGIEKYWGRWFYWEDSLFIGAGALALAVFGAIAGRPKYRRFAVTMLIISFVLAIGYYTPLYVPLYRHLPGFESFRGVSKFAFLAGLFLANLVAVGFHRLLHISKVPMLPVRIIVGFAMVCTLCAAAIWYSGPQGLQGKWGHLFARVNWHDEGRQYGLFQGQNLVDKTAAEAAGEIASNLLLAAGACALVGACWAAAVKQRRWAYGIAGIVIVELLCFCWQNRPTFDLNQFGAQLPAYHEVLGRVRAVDPDARALTPDGTIYMMAGGSDAWGNDPMVLRRYADLIAYGQGVSGDELMRRSYPFFNNPGPLWGLVRIGGFLVPGGPQGMRLLPYRGRHFRRAQLIDSARVVDARQMLPMLASPIFDVKSIALIEEPVADIPTSAGGFGPAGTVELTDRNTDLIEIDADVKRPCILLFSDNYSTGWRARSLDAGSSQKYQVIRADYTLRAIPLTPGHHHIALEYLPLGYILGKWISIVAIITFFLTALLAWKPWKPRAPTSQASQRRT